MLPERRKFNSFQFPEFAAHGPWLTQDQEIALGPPIRYYGRISYKWTRMCSFDIYIWYHMIKYLLHGLYTMFAHLSQEELYQLSISMMWFCIGFTIPKSSPCVWLGLKPSIHMVPLWHCFAHIISFHQYQPSLTLMISINHEKSPLIIIVN